MRFIYTVFIILLCSITAFAQRNQSSLSDAFMLRGTFLLGGNLTTSFKGYSSDRGDQKNINKGTVFRINLDTKVGYFAMEDVAFGLNANLRHSWNKQKNENDPNVETTLLFGPFVRAYLNNGIFGEVGLGMGLDNIKQGSQKDLFSADLGVGYSYFITKKIALEPMIVFNYYKQRLGGELGSDNSEYGPEFRLGISAYLLKHRRTIPK
ncbi:hypothetical protein [Adhaeribacter aquaticus]|uniref:hypothetical protein n=1 Tax=Adhaeribacter aquaticus TaxID=299567 RepID=UPI00040A0EAD|nr:hypothetical protein [Adhaeribacter aquaticus]